MQNGGPKWGVANHFWLKHAALFCLLHVVLKLLCSFCFPPSLHSLNFGCFTHCGHCCLLLATTLCNNISVVCVRPSKRITVSPTEGITRQQLMVVEAKRKHVQTGTAPMFLKTVPPLTRSKPLLVWTHTNNRYTPTLKFILVFPENWTDTGACFGALHQVFICQFSGCRCRALLKTSRGISWRCHGLDTTSYTQTRTRMHGRTHCVFFCDKKSRDLGYFSP